MNEDPSHERVLSRRLRVLLAISIGLLAAFSPAPGRTQDVPAADVEALLVRGQYEQAESVARARVDAQKAAHGDGSFEAADASDLLIRSLLLNGKGSLTGTLALAERTVQVKEARLGPAHLELTPSLLNLGDALVEAAKYGRAIEVTQRAVTLQEARIHSSELADSLDHLGSALSATDRYDDALTALDRSLRVKESVLGREDVRLARTLEAIAWAHQRKANYDPAGAAIRRAVAIQEHANPFHPSYVQTLNLLGLQLWFEGRLPEARDVSARAVSLAERTLRPDHPTTARALKYLAGASLGLGDVAEARSLFERALAIAERAFGQAHRETWAYLNDLAEPTNLLGDYPAARRLYERSLKIAEESFGPWHDSVATAVHNLALTDAHLGDYASARREQLRATAIWERVFGRDHTFVAIALTELAAVYREQGAAAEALPLLERALTIRERRLGPEHRDVASTLADLAATLMQMNQIARAQALAVRALRIWERVGAPGSPDSAAMLTMYADLQARRGDPIDARRYYDRALTIEENVYGRRHPVFADTEARVARVLADAGDAPAAFAAATEAENTGREHLRLMLRYLPERQSLSYAARRPRGLDLVLSLVGSVPNAATPAMDELIRSRALVLDEMAERRRETGAAGEDIGLLRAHLASAQQRLANLVVRGPDAQTPAVWGAFVEAARSESERAESALADRSAPFRSERDRSQLGFQRVRDAVPRNSALVSFVRYERVRVEPRLQEARSTGQRRSSPRTVTSYLAFIVKQRDPPIVVPLGAAAVVDPLVARWRADIVAEGLQTAGRTGEGSPSTRVSGTALRKHIWDPIADYLRDVGKTFIVPDGTLSLVPFAALPIGRAEYLLENGPVIHYLSAERDLVSLPGESSTLGRGVLALGGPAFDDRTQFVSRNRAEPLPKAASRRTASLATDCGDFRTATFSDLPGTLQEARDVANLWKDSGTARVEDRLLLVARDASERALKQLAPGRRVLHLATHGFFVGGPCLPSVGSLRSVGGLVQTSSAAQGNPTRILVVENPLLLSGLALAGANRRAAAGPGDEDGILTAEEVATLNLEGVEWAVLSACNTGVGELKGGEGVIGLRRAFQIAGARTVIMSLWSVDDQATRAWMRALYEGRFRKGLTTADAVREAGLDFLRVRRSKGQSTDPFYWAAFVAAGDWR